MSSSRGSGAGVQAIPAGSRKVVQSLKEIVSCPEAEIYAALKECNMDPNEAVNRLLSQDPFHEVKSKREKKKEGKDNSESRARGANNNSSRRSRNGADRQLGRGVSAAYNASESSFHVKSTYKKENGSTPYTSYLPSGSDMSGNNKSGGPSGFSDGASAESKGSFLGTSDVTLSVAQPASAYQSAWVGTSGQVSMADIVRMGRPHNKASNASRHNVQDPPKVHHSEVSSVEVSVIDEWPSIEKPAPATVIPLSEYTVDSELHPELSGVGVPSDSNNHHYETDEIREREDDNVETSGGNDLASVSISSREVPEIDSRGASLFENELYKSMGSYHSEAPDFELHEDEEVDASVSSVTRNLQQLNVEKDERGFPSEGSAPSVVIPDHLQVQVADCSHLSFGSFGASMSAPYSSGTTASVPANTNSEEKHIEADNSSAPHVETRNSEYYIDDSLRNAPDSNLFPSNGTNGASVGSYDASSASQSEELKPESAEVAHQYPFPSNPGYNLDDAQRLNAPYNETSSQMQNLSSFSNVMQPYANSLPSTLLTGNVHSARESDLQYSPFLVSHSMSAKYANSVSSVGGSAISMSEALKTGGLSSTQAVPQAASGTSVATGPPLPQHIAVHPFSQLPITSMVGYPFFPQNYTYMPSAFQQSFAGSSAYHQSLAALLPQFKSSVSVSSLPQSAAVPSGYGAFGSNTTLPGNYPMNPPAAPSGSTLSYDDVLSSQYKENSQLLSLQQNENPAMWLQGHSSRTVQAVPSSTYYNYPGQNQQASGFRQAQQQSQNYGAPGYPNYYHSQTLDQQQNPNPRDGAQGQPKQSQMWPNSY